MPDPFHADFHFTPNNLLHDAYLSVSLCFTVVCFSACSPFRCLQGWNFYIAVCVCAQMADTIEARARDVAEGAPEIAEEAQKQAEISAEQLSKNARPTADDLSESIEGTARHVSKGGCQFFSH